MFVQHHWALLRLTCWLLDRAESGLEVRYKKGKNNQHADSRSRRITGSTTVENDKDEIPLFFPEEPDDDAFIESLELYTTMDFIESAYGEPGHFLGIDEPKESLQDKVTME